MVQNEPILLNKDQWETGVEPWHSVYRMIKTQEFEEKRPGISVIPVRIGGLIQ
jgi:hypothetical protein